MGWATGTTTLWTAVNERDGLGDDLVPDNTTSVKEDGFYGWPFAYFEKNPNPRMKGERMDLVNTTLTPDISMGAQTTSLGLAFNDKNKLTAPYNNGIFIGNMVHGTGAYWPGIKRCLCHLKMAGQQGPCWIFSPVLLPVATKAP